MKSYPLIAGSLFCEPWLITPEMHATLSQGFRDYLAATDPVGPSWVRWNGEQAFSHPQVEVFDGVAYLMVAGVLGKNLSSLEMMCGGYDLTSFQKQLENVRDDDSICSLVLQFDSPGGRAQGVEAAALAIREVADSGKLVLGYSEGFCASAGYFLAAACDKLYAHNDALIGSISTVCAGVDSSRAWEMEGLELKLVATGSLKAMGHPGKKWTEEEMAFMRERAQVVDDVFKGFVRERRGLGEEAMNGGHWYARKSPEKLHDGIRNNIESVIEEGWNFDGKVKA